MKKTTLVLVMVLAAGAMPLLAPGSIIVYDPFGTGTLEDAQANTAYLAGVTLNGPSNSSTVNTNVGNLAGEWSGEGRWTGSWSQAYAWNVGEGSLNYTGGSSEWMVDTAGGRLVYNPGGTGNVTNRHFLLSADAITDGAVYFSFLSEWGQFATGSNMYGVAGGANSQIAYLRFAPVSGTDGQEGTVQLLGTAGSSGAISDNFLQTGETYFFVARYTLDSSSLDYTLTLWVNPDLDAIMAGTTEDDLAPGQYLHKLTTSATSDTAYSARYWLIPPRITHENFQQDFDELRIGTSWDSVVDITAIPEPATMLLGLTGLAGLAAIRRRRRMN